MLGWEATAKYWFTSESVTGAQARAHTGPPVKINGIPAIQTVSFTACSLVTKKLSTAI